MDNSENIVVLYYKKTKSASAYKTNRECWITMIEQSLLMEVFADYTLEVDYGPYDNGTKIIITFSNPEDAAYFRLKHQ